MVRSAIFALLVAAGVLASEPAHARRVHGAEIPVPSPPVPGDASGTRFVVQKRFEQALRFLRRTYRRERGIVIEQLRTPLRVRAFVVRNTRRGRTWDAINLYEDEASRTVYLTVLPSERE